MSRNADKSLLAIVSDALASYWLAITVIAFLFLLTVLGTLEQTRTSLFEVQQRYFESLFVFHKIGPIPVPLPGVYLLLVILAVNLVWGGIVRIRKDRTTWAILITHAGILVMFAGAGIEYYSSQKGHATLAEGDSTSEFSSYYDWEIAISEARQGGPVTEFVVPGEKFMRLGAGQRAKFTSPELPFDVSVHDPLPNCEPQPAPGAGVDGMALVERARNKEAEADTAGVYVTIEPKSGGQPTEGILWGRERFPMSVMVDGRRFTLDMSHRRWKLPFQIHLDDFRQALHPGTGMAKAFESDVTKIQNGIPQKVKISMNAPLRQSGFTLYQSGFIEPQGGGGGRWWSTFSVVRNPADQVPLISCIIITIGLLAHFTQKLVRHVRTQKSRSLT